MKSHNGRLVYTDPNVAEIVKTRRKRDAKNEIRSGAMGLLEVIRVAFWGLVGIIGLGLFLQLVTGSL